MNGISPLTQSIGWTNGISETREKLFDLQRQLGTGRLSETHGGLGSGRTIALSMQARIAKIEGYQANISTLNLRLDVMSLTIDRFSELVSETKSEVRTAGYVASSPGRTLAQDMSLARFDEALASLGAEVAGRHLFSGQAVDRKPTESADVILHGDGIRAGLDTLISERKLADAGADGRGRLALTNGGTSLTIAEDGAHDFGFKLSAIASDVAGATLIQPGGVAPQSASISLTGQPAVGDTVTLVVDLPDGSSETIQLTADGGGANGFAIGADETATIANIEAALGDALESVATTTLDPASAIATSRAFFEADIDNPPQRVDGPPFESATGFVPGTAADTVIWYVGEPGTGSARETAITRIDDNQAVAYGARANEEPFSWALAHMAAFAVDSFDPAEATDNQRHTEFVDRVVDGLAYNGGQRTVQSVVAEFVGIQSAYGAASERHQSAIGIAQQALSDATGIDDQEVAVSMLRLQTQLQTAYEATALISRLSLTNFI